MRLAIATGIAVFIIWIVSGIVFYQQFTCPHCGKKTTEEILSAEGKP